MIIAELEEVSDNRECSWYLRKSFDLWDIGGGQTLCGLSVSITCAASKYPVHSTHQEDDIKQDRTQGER